MCYSLAMSRDVHARPAGATPDGQDVAAAAPTHAERARTLVASLATGTLCTLAKDPAGYPYGSLVTFGLGQSGPVFLISELAEHTRNLRQDARASLLVAENRPGDPLANGRVTLLGNCTPVGESELPEAREAYLERWPNAAGHAQFGDFGFWSLSVQAVRYIGGYGRMSWVSGEEWGRAVPDPIAPDAAAILEHMNQDHADALPLYCQAFSRLTDVQDATMTSIDRLGFEMSVVTPSGTRTVRLAFAEPIRSKADARRALVGLLREARAKLGV
jgi:putative heme iron utilization protein